MDIDYINDIKCLVLRLSYIIRHARHLDESSIDEMLTLTIDLLQILELYKNDKYYDYQSTKKQKPPTSISSFTNKPTINNIPRDKFISIMCGNLVVKRYNLVHFFA